MMSAIKTSIAPVNFADLKTRFKLQRFKEKESAPLEGLVLDATGPDVLIVLNLANQPGGMDRIWTLVTSDGIGCIAHGFHVINSEGYLISEVALNIVMHHDIQVYSDLQIDEQLMLCIPDLQSLGQTSNQQIGLLALDLMKKVSDYKLQVDDEGLFLIDPHDLIKELREALKPLSGVDSAARILALLQEDQDD